MLKETFHRFFDNVGGKVLNANMKRIAVKGKIIVCGAISTYDRTEKFEFEPPAYMQLVSSHTIPVAFNLTNHLVDPPARKYARLLGYALVP